MLVAKKLACDKHNASARRTMKLHIANAAAQHYIAQDITQ